LASAALASALLLAGCETDSTVAPSLRSLQPLSAQMLADIEQKNMSKESPVLVRLFKEESELEVWKQDRNGRFALLKTYPICRWSGELGPKIKEGDRQAPEGFYTITPSLMNPNSSYYLAINTGFPNAYDRANGRTGNFLMIHGDCSSRGCYAMTDEQIGEIYSLARESFFGGQRAFQIQAYPFRMTPLNMAKHRNSPHMAFWRMLKQGYDHFEVSRQEPKVDVCEKRYVFDAEAKGVRFAAADRCPAYKVDPDLVAAVTEKQQRDERQVAELIKNGTPTVPVLTHTDGGMHPTFLAAFQKPYTDSAGIIRSPNVSLPGTIPAHAVPPHEPDGSTGSLADQVQATRTRVAAVPADSSASEGSNSGGFFDRMSRMMGFGSEPAPQATTPAPAKRKAAPQPKTQIAATAPKAKSPGESKQATAESKQNAGAIRPQPTKSADASGMPTASSAGLLNGAQPAVPSGQFDDRWGAFRQ
jgi:murein L,D-transpeptidase YafK